MALVSRYLANKLIGRGPLCRRLAALMARRCLLAMLCGIVPAFAGLFPTRRKIVHVLRTRSPRARPLYCYSELRVRLACVKHAASVRSEPGSNSRLKLVALGGRLRIRRHGRYRSELLNSLGFCHPEVRQHRTKGPLFSIHRSGCQKELSKPLPTLLQRSRGGSSAVAQRATTENGFWHVSSDCQRAGTPRPAGRTTDKPQLYGLNPRVSSRN